MSDTPDTPPARRRFPVPRRIQVMALLCLLSALYWGGVWAWTQKVTAEQLAAGAHPATVTVDVFGLVFQATWAWAVGGAVLHAVLAAVSAWRRDRQALAGVGWSAVLHVAFAWSTGILGG
ncbi:MAG: hypothetical protein H6733_14195 [Alphaproteobacteria bacterium]|nr:hypothetical protein [Alphaproteobacteria bacterium]